MLLKDGDDFDLRRFLVIFERGLAKGRRIAEENARRVSLKNDDPGALRVLIASLPRRACGLSEEARMLLAERMRDAADAVERLVD